MYSRLLAACVFTYLGLCAVSSVGYARCQTVTFSQQGAWDAYGGPCDNDSKMCGISTSGKGAFFGIKYFSGDNYFTVQLGDESWRIKDGAKQQVTMEIDDYGKWSVVGNGFHFGNGTAGLEFQVPRNRLDQFMSEFRQGGRMAVRFPGADSVSSWNVSLYGSDFISSSFLNCIKTILR
jgi:hypothetical protein